jgi:hypothetical protein
MSPSRPAKIALAALLFAAPATQVFSQQTHTPYAGLQSRAIKALSAEQTADLTAGRGMGLALAAELNGYPGPLHVLQLAEPLALSDAQRAAVQRQFEAMQAEAIALGKRLIEAETELDRAFADNSITPEQLKTVTARIGEIGGALRNTHLRHHLSTKALLNAEQVRRYAELRGYPRGAPAHDADAHKMHHSMPRH